MRLTIISFLFCFLTTIIYAQSTSPYFPSAEKWEMRRPERVGFDTALLNEAIRYSQKMESRNSRSMEENHFKSFGKEPHGEPIGPFKDRGALTGLIIHKGYIIAEWGEPGRIDMTHSVTKSFLSTLVGLAIQDKRISSVHDTVSKYITTVQWIDSSVIPAQTRTIQPFAGPHNETITWESMLRQSSDWEGTLFSKPDWADRPDRDSTKWLNRKRNAPGAVFEYNDVRVNAMALAATVLFKNSLPDVFRERIMNPIGASSTWKWHGYKTSWIILGKRKVEVVSGGGHWGGGMFINAYDMARFGLLTLNDGKWKNKQLIPKNWIAASATPGPANIGYGYMNYFLNTDQKYIPLAPKTAFVHVGNGTNVVYVDKENDLVIVLRWIENGSVDEVVGMVLAAIKKNTEFR
ncbi:MAG: serine hydrolase [Chitinophagaceae bacterium]|nr:serine hydrolase [Chitinophagaceae bacterium]